jgi:hypothetical protein
MSYRTIASITAAALIGIACACVSTEASARGGGRAAGVHHGGHAAAVGVHRGAVVHRGVRRGVAVGVGAAAVGAGVAAQCGYYPYPPCY